MALIRTSSTTWEDTVDPTVTSDSSVGYQVGDYHRNTVSKDVFYIKDTTVGAAVWVNADPSAGGGSTNLSIGTKTGTTVDIDSDTGTNATIPEATVTEAGLLSSAKRAEIIANNAKLTNATHTGEIIGSGALTADPTLITNKPSATVASTDTLLISDTDDSGNLKEVTAQSIADLGSGSGDNPTDSTGVLTGGELSVGTGGPGVATTYDITDGTAEIVDATGATTDVSWSGLTGETPIFGPSVITFVAINSGGTVTQQSTPFTRAQSRSLILLGVIVHVNGVNVDTINNEQKIAYNVMSSLYDAMESIGFFNVTGNVFSANGTNMNINKSLGSLFKMGSNYDTDPTTNPHVRPNAATTGGIFQYRFSDGSSGSLSETDIDPDNLDDGSGGTTAVGNNRWSVQRIYIFTSNNIKIQRGVEDFASSDAAIQGITTEPYITESSLTANALFRGWLIIKEGATALDGSDAIFLSSGKFGESGGSVGSGSTTTLQVAYDNSPDSEIVIPSGATNAFSLEAATDGAEIIQDWKDETSSITASITGDGNLVVVDVNGVPLTTGGASTNYLDETGNYSIPNGLTATTKTSGYTAVNGDMVVCNTATMDVTLPTAAENLRIGVKAIVAPTSINVVAAAAAETVDGVDRSSGGTPLPINNQWEALTLFTYTPDGGSTYDWAIENLKT